MLEAIAQLQASLEQIKLAESGFRAEMVLADSCQDCPKANFCEDFANSLLLLAEELKKRIDYAIMKAYLLQSRNR